MMSEKTLKTVSDYVKTFRSLPEKLEGFDEYNCLTVYSLSIREITRLNPF